MYRFMAATGFVMNFESEREEKCNFITELGSTLLMRSSLGGEGANCVCVLRGGEEIVRFVGWMADR